MNCNKKKSVLMILMAIIIASAIFISIYILTPKIKPKQKLVLLRKICPSGDCNFRSDRYNRTTREPCDARDCLLVNKNVTRSSSMSMQKMCTSEECVLEAAKMLKWIDTKVDPCVDFYNFSCGNFLSSHTVPEGWSSYSIIQDAEEAIAVTLKNILEKPVKVQSSDALTKVRQLYKTCMNLTHIEEYSKRDLKELLTGSGIGDFPFLNSNWQDCRLDLEWRMAKLNSLGIDSLFKLDIEFKGDNDRAFLYLSPASPLVDNICDGDEENETLILEKAVEYRKILTSFLTLLDVEINNITEKDIDELLLFDFTFCNITKASREEHSSSVEPSTTNQTLPELLDIAPEINWIRWRNIIFSGLQLNFPHDKLHIYVHGMNGTIENIIELLHNTSSKILANYLTWKFAFHHLGFMGKPFRQIVENHPKVFLANLDFFMRSDRWLPRWQQCVTYVEDLMPIALLPQYLHRVLTPDMQKEMDFVVSSVKNEFRDIFRLSSALLRDEKVKSIHKIDQVNVELFYPDREKKFFDKYYKEMGKLGENFMRNGMKVRMSLMRRYIEGAYSVKSQYDLEFRSVLDRLFSANAISAFRANKIILYLGMLEVNKISSKLPRFLSMSTLGFVIGHELTHGFDMASINTLFAWQHYNWTLWPEYVIKHAEKKAQCFFNQYSKHRTVKDSAYANESTYVSNDIADNQGLYLTYKAYMKYLLNNGEEKYLPGFPYSNEQLFFIRYAQSMCTIYSPGAENEYSFHSPSNLRVNELLKNFEPFSEHFKCLKDSPMNPRYKCENLWV